MPSTIALADVFARLYQQVGMDGFTLAATAAAIRETLPEDEREAFTHLATMSGLPLAPTADPTRHDPHGNPWTLLSAEELEARKGWCMAPEYHDALQLELDRRNGLTRYYAESDAPRAF